MLSIIIVNYNGGVLVERCLASIYENPPSEEFEIIFIDNASKDGSLQRVKQLFPSLSYIVNTENLGLSKSFNQGLAIAKGDYLLSLDNDTRILPGALDALITLMKIKPDAGAVGSKLLNPDMTPQNTARIRPSAINAIFGRRSWITKVWPSNPVSRRYLMQDKINLEQPFEVDWLSTAALMVSRDAYAKVGGLDEAFFVYWVDADWCERIKSAGLKIYCEPASLIIHDENLKAKRRTKKNYRMVADFHQGAYRYYIKHHAAGSRCSPKSIIALLGLGLRAGLIIGLDYVKFNLNSLRLKT